MGDSTPEEELRTQIDRLRKEFPATQDLYREVCVLLFFRHGITPTANRLYQLVRKGSMSAPAEALARFWENLRQKSRVRIENPDLPEDLRDAAGTLAAAFWAKAQAAAQVGLEALHVQAKSEVAAAQSAQAQAQAQAAELHAELDAARLALERAGQRTRELHGQLLTERAARAAVEDRLAQALAEQAGLQQTLAQAQRDFAAEFERMRAAAELAQVRLRASEEKALLEIDRERSTSNRLAKELEESRRSALDADQRNRAQLDALQEELGVTRQRLGALEGSMEQVQAARTQLSAQLDSARSIAAEQSAALAVARRDNELAAGRIQDLATQVDALNARIAAPVAATAAKASREAIRRRGRRSAKKEPSGTLL